MIECLEPHPHGQLNAHGAHVITRVLFIYEVDGVACAMVYPRRESRSAEMFDQRHLRLEAISMYLH